jgi:hypothetical protein
VADIYPARKRLVRHFSLLKWPAENGNRALWQQHRGPLLKKREKWRTPVG